MNIIDCKKNSNCNNTIKSPTQFISIRPGDNESAYNILKCNKNNYSKTCPSLICNFKKQNQQNKDIFTRNFPDIKIKPIESYRPEFDICHKSINLNKNNTRLKQNLTNKITNFQNIKTNFIPGKGIGIEYLRNIDIDSELKCVNHKNTLCPRKKYLPNINCNSNKKNPYCELYKKPHKNKIPKTYCDNKLQKKNSNQINVRDYNLINMNYNVCKFTMQNNKKCLINNISRNCDPILPFKQPVLFQYDRTCSNSLRVGPTKKFHKCENLWNNLTRRKNI